MCIKSAIRIFVPHHSHNDEIDSWIFLLVETKLVVVNYQLFPYKTKLIDNTIDKFEHFFF